MTDELKVEHSWKSIKEIKNDKGQLHSEIEPALVYKSGEEHWYLNGLKHRIDGPAETKPNGDYTWYKNGKKHRDGNLPASQWGKGRCIEWYVDGKKQRSDGPAMIYTIDNFSIEKWYHNNKLHRKDGPAVTSFEQSSNTIDFTEWYSHGRRHRLDGPAIQTNSGVEYWYKNGSRHREDGPAMIDSYGSIWIQDDMIHRDDGPAIEKQDGTKEWFWYNGHHNLYDPAIIDKDGLETYYLYGEEMHENWNHLLSHMIVNDLFCYHQFKNLRLVNNLMDGNLPNPILGLDSELYHNGVGCLHREDAPAYKETELSIGSFMEITRDLMVQQFVEMVKHIGL